MRLDMLERTWMTDKLWFPNNSTERLDLLQLTSLKAVSNPVVLCVPCIKLAAKCLSRDNDIPCQRQPLFMDSALRGM